MGKETCIGQGIDVKVSLTCTEGAKTYIPELFEKECLGRSKCKFLMKYDSIFEDFKCDEELK